MSSAAKAYAWNGDDDRVSFHIDATMYEAHNAIPRNVYGDLDRVVRGDLYYHYSTPICAQRWLDLCNDPGYGHATLLSELDLALPDLVEALSADRITGSFVRVTSLGPGDGAVDERLLAGLSRDFGVSSYRGLDFSFDLLRRAAHRLASSDTVPDTFPIEMVCGDFTDLEATLARDPDRTGRQLFTLTGFTFGNYREDELLESIGRLMKPGDYLLMDARLHDEGLVTDEDLTSGALRGDLTDHYDVGAVRRFVFGPVEVATTATVDDVEVRFDAARTLTRIPGAVNLMIYCTGLDTTLRLTGEPVRRDRLDLAVTTSYHLPALVDWLDDTAFSTVWHRKFDHSAFFLLRRA
ncbi:MAG TPA: L-histidine N(alpha)-methyltransferase [Longimicrobiales bacterium]|nr:L-histidine N(alpha)-methyltransferase [Longimicrobiales bacterium]